MLTMVTLNQHLLYSLAVVITAWWTKFLWAHYHPLFSTKPSESAWFFTIARTMFSFVAAIGLVGVMMMRTGVRMIMIITTSIMMDHQINPLGQISHKSHLATTSQDHFHDYTITNNNIHLDVGITNRNNELIFYKPWDGIKFLMLILY